MNWRRVWTSDRLMIYGAGNNLKNGATLNNNNNLLSPYLVIFLLWGGEPAFIGKHDVGWVNYLIVLLETKPTILIKSIAMQVVEKYVSLFKCYASIHHLTVHNIVHLFDVGQCCPVMIVESKSLSALCHQFMLMSAKESFPPSLWDFAILDPSFHSIWNLTSASSESVSFINCSSTQ